MAKMRYGLHAGIQHSVQRWIHCEYGLMLTANVTPKYIGPVTLVMDAESKLLGFIAEIHRISN
jgi:hypothetical protein